MLPLRYPWLWRLVGWALIAAVAIGSLMPGAHIPNVNVGDKLLHAAAYFLLMIWFAGLYPRRKHAWIAIALLLLGVALDVLQGVMTTSRQFDPRDIVANAAGIGAALLLSVWLLEGWCQRMERLIAPQV